jgi:hypothetical protein
MESNISLLPVMDEKWIVLIRPIEQELEESARQDMAMIRRRLIQTAANLLRLVMLYVARDFSLCQTGAWGTLLKLGSLSDVAVLQRLRRCGRWLGHLIALLLLKQRIGFVHLSGVRIRLVDATVISRPGSRGTDWRLHLSLDLGRLALDGIELTDAKGGETLARCQVKPGDILIADRGLAFLRSLGSVFQTAYFIVRTNWQALAFKNADGTRFDIAAWLHQVNDACEHTVWIRLDESLVPVRLIANPLPPEKAEIARSRARNLSESKGHTPHANTLLSAGFLMLVTNLPTDQYAISQILMLYRMRWQIEMYFKRLKGLLTFDHLRAQDPQLAQTYLLGKVLLAILVDLYNQQINSSAPDWFSDPTRPVSLWRLTQLSLERICSHIYSTLEEDYLLTHLDQLKRYFTDSPRRRPQLLAWFRLYASLSFGC